MKVPLGRVVITRGAIERLTALEIRQALHRPSNGEWGEWGDLDSEDSAANDQALEHGDQLLSAYNTADRVLFWIITEWDRSVTTILLPEEY